MDILRVTIVNWAREIQMGLLKSMCDSYRLISHMCQKGTFERAQSWCGGNDMCLNSIKCFNTAIFKRHSEAWV